MGTARELWSYFNIIPVHRISDKVYYAPVINIFEFKRQFNPYERYLNSVRCHPMLQ